MTIKHRITAAVAIAMTTALAVSGCSQGDPLSSNDSRASGDTIIVGSADFPENQLLATIFSQALNNAGLSSQTKLNIGSREVYIPALKDGSIDLIPEYSGATLSYLNPTSVAHKSDEVLTALAESLPAGLDMLKPAEAQTSDVLAVKQETAAKYSLTTIEDLVPVADQLVLGGPPEWKTRYEGVAGLQDVYGLVFKEFKSLDVTGPLTLSALRNGQIQVADLTSTDPAIAENKWVTLVDNKNLFAAQNIVPIISTQKVNPDVTRVLNQVTSALTTDDLKKMNGRIANKESLDSIASDWISEKSIS